MCPQSNTPPMDQDSDTRKCARCGRHRPSTAFKEGMKSCDLCREYHRQYWLDHSNRRPHLQYEKYESLDGRVCPSCNNYRPPDYFKGKFKTCQVCRDRRKHLYAGKGLEWKKYRRAQMAARRYGITLDDYLLLQDRANSACDICGNPQAHTYRGGATPLDIDHDHRTGKIRGVICHRCNLLVSSIEALLPDGLGLIDQVIHYIKSNGVG